MAEAIKGKKFVKAKGDLGRRGMMMMAVMSMALAVAASVALRIGRVFFAEIERLYCHVIGSRVPIAAAMTQKWRSAGRPVGRAHNSQTPPAGNSESRRACCRWAAYLS
jgi:hypothetical protein